MNTEKKIEIDYLIKENTALKAKLSEINREKLALMQASTLLNSAIETNKILDLILSLAKSIIFAEAASLLLIDKLNPSFLKFYIAQGEKADKLRDVRVPVGEESIAGWVAKYGTSLLVKDVQSDTRFFREVDQKTEFITKSIICVPLRCEGKLIGVIEVLNKKGQDNFDEEDVKLLEALANQAGIAIEKAKLLNKIKEEKLKIEFILKSMQDALIVTDTQQNIVLMNQTAEKLFDKNDERLKLTLSETTNISEEDMFDLILMKPDKIILSGNITRMRMEENKPLGTIISFRNVTKQRKAQRLRAEFLAFLVHKLLDEFNSFQFDKSIYNFSSYEFLELKQLIAKLLYFSELEAGPLRLDRTRFILKEFLMPIISEINEVLKLKECEIKTEINIPENKEIVADKERLKQMFSSILLGPSRLLKEKKSTLNIKIGVDILKGIEYLCCSIAIKNFKLEHETISLINKKLFLVEKFLQPDGDFIIELIFAKHIIDAHSGNLLIESDEDNTMFSITIPLETFL